MKYILLIGIVLAVLVVGCEVGELEAFIPEATNPPVTYTHEYLIPDGTGGYRSGTEQEMLDYIAEANKPKHLYFLVIDGEAIQVAEMEYKSYGD